VEFGKVGTPSTMVEDLTAALTRAIEELTRPIDAIKHQAKTVTVGISRSDETLLQVRLVQEVLGAGVARDNLTYRTLRTLVDLHAAVEQVVGFTRYRIDGDPARDDATIHVVDRGGLGSRLRSRTDADPRLRGTKQLAAAEREVTVAVGRSDGRTVILVPEVKGNQTIGMTLLHVQFRHRLAPDVARAVLMGYRHRYAALKGAVTEVEPTFADAVLGDVDVAELLTRPVAVLAERWRTGS
jgi:glucosamine--fructose-6-phosphate aminotransferase (isomerizing)